MHTSTFARTRLLPLDAMRGAAALLVAIGHFKGVGAVDIGNAFALCVPFFLILSGYVLSHAYGSEIADDRLSLRRFTMLRLARLYPLHVITFAAVLGFWLSIELARKFIALPISSVVGLHATAAEWIETLTLTHFLFGGGVSFNTPSWSISVEFLCGFYLFALWAAPTPKLRAALVCVGLTALAFVIQSGGLLGSNISPAAKTYGIGLGCFALGWLLYRWSDRIELLTRALPSAVWWSIATLVLLSLITLPGLADHKYAEAGYYAAFSLLIAGLARTPVQFGAAVMEKAGDWSYGIYLWHMPLALALRAFAIATEAVLGIPLLHSPILDALYVPLLIAVSAASYRYVEMPAKIWLRNVGFRLDFRS